jgi:chromosome segregation ATPase
MSKNASTVTLSLGSNVLALEEATGRWVSHSTDLEEAEGEIDALIEERGEILASLDQAQEHVHKLKEELIKSDKTKAVVMQMLSEEREKRLSMEHELKGYKDELRRSYKVIVELRKIIAGPGLSSS